MVSYEIWVGVVRKAAADKGADVSDFDTNSEVVSAAAELWREYKSEIEQMTVEQAKELARREVSVS